MTTRDLLRTAGNVLLVLAPVALYAFMLAYCLDRGILALDFDTYAHAAGHIVDGETPYDTTTYPPLVAYLAVPFVVLPASEVVVSLLGFAALAAALAVLGIRDWRCYAAASLWGPTVHAVQTGNVTAWLVLAVALCWRWRDSAGRVALTGGLAVAAKAVVWPLAVWQLGTRRWRGGVGIALVTLAVTLVLAGADLLLDTRPTSVNSFPDPGEELTGDSYTLQSLAADLGLPNAVGVAASLLALAAVVAACVVLGRRGDDRRSYALAAVAMIVGAPHVWLHSFVLLLPMLAVLRPRLSWPWLLPVLLLLASGNGRGSATVTAGTLAVAGVVVAACLWRPDGGGRLEPARYPRAITSTTASR